MVSCGNYTVNVSGIIPIEYIKPVERKPTEQVLQKGKTPGAQYIRMFDIKTGSEMANKTDKIFECVPMTGAVPKTPICIYDPNIDQYVSGSIKKYGNWEGGNIKLTVKYLNLYPDMQFLDLGCNIGAFTISIVKHGRRTVSVDANAKNLRMLSKSLVLGDLQNSDITLLWNGISDKIETIHLQGGTKNVGGMHAISSNASANSDDITAMAVTLDDIAYLFDKTPSLFIKMDIETNEWKALVGGKDFFSNINVPYVLLEFMHHKTRPEGELIINYFKERNYTAYHPYSMPKELRQEERTNWPNDVLFVKQGAKLS